MKKFFIGLIGGTVLLLGVAMLVLPGPGMPVVAAGLAILATEFFWARRAMRRAKGAVAKVRRKSGLKEWLQRRRAARLAARLAGKSPPHAPPGS
ncbi:MAG: PGPGW domain-containing protein [Verrucomicrobiota bacterium]